MHMLKRVGHGAAPGQPLQDRVQVCCLAFDTCWEEAVYSSWMMRQSLPLTPTLLSFQERSMPDLHTPLHV
jgi:hypothetical protein